MSHNVELKGTKINDLAALEQAIGELSRDGAGVRLDMNAKTFRTYRGQDNKCDAAIIMGTGSHDIGLIKQPDGSFVPRFDPYDFSRDLRVDQGAENFQLAEHGAVRYDEASATTSIGKLLQRYGVCKVEREAAMRGQTANRSTNTKTGVVELTISVN